MKAMIPSFLRGVSILLACGVGLSGCTSVDPTAGLSPAGDLTGGRLAPMGGQPVHAAASVASAASVGPIQFLPVVGAPVEAAEALSAALANAAAQAGVTILASDGPTAPRRLKGYLSALPEGRDTIVVYVFDVVDPAGERIGRIQGQERAPHPGSATDPWAGLPPATFEAIARRTMLDLAKTTTGS